jgi:hypothetical protein
MGGTPADVDVAVVLERMAKAYSQRGSAEILPNL